MSGHELQTARPNCRLCRHFYITHEPAHPYGCKALSFKSSKIPVDIVFASSGMECQMFSPKGEKKG